MINRDEIIEWLGTLNAGSEVYIDDGGLSLVEVFQGEETGAYIEIGGYDEE